MNGSVGTWLMVGSGLLTLLMGVAVKHLKWYWLISGYNTMSKEKKQQVDADGLGRYVGNFMFILAALLLGGAGLNAAGMHTAFLMAMMGVVLLMPVAVYKAQRFDPSSYTQEGKLKASVKGIIGLVAGGCLLLVVLIGYGMTPPKMTVTEETFKVSGLYGTTFHRHRVETVMLVDQIPEIRRKTGGMDAGPVRKGWFELESGESALLFVTLHRPPVPGPVRG